MTYKTKQGDYKTPYHYTPVWLTSSHFWTYTTHGIVDIRLIYVYILLPPPNCDGYVKSADCLSLSNVMEKQMNGIMDIFIEFSWYIGYDTRNRHRTLSHRNKRFHPLYDRRGGVSASNITEKMINWFSWDFHEISDITLGTIWNIFGGILFNPLDTGLLLFSGPMFVSNITENRSTPRVQTSATPSLKNVWPRLQQCKCPTYMYPENDIKIRSSSFFPYFFWVEILIFIQFYQNMFSRA